MTFDLLSVTRSFRDIDLDTKWGHWGEGDLLLSFTLILIIIGHDLFQYTPKSRSKVIRCSKCYNQDIVFILCVSKMYEEFVLLVNCALNPLIGIDRWLFFVEWKWSKTCWEPVSRDFFFCFRSPHVTTRDPFCPADSTNNQSLHRPSFIANTMSWN